MFDVHTHLNDDKLFDDSARIIDELGNYGIDRVIVPSCDKAMCEKTLELIKNKKVFGALGIHPSNADEFDESVANLIKKTAQNPKIVAVGEIGLDLHYEGSNLIKQQQVFVKQLEIANECKLPIILHLRDAWEEFFDVFSANKNLFLNGVDVHCFDGDVEIAKKLINEGFFISLTAMSVENRGKLKEMIRFLPLDRIMLETDSPYLTPPTLRHLEKFNTPKNVCYVAECVAKYKELDLEIIKEQTTKNALKLFKKMGEFDAKQ